MRIYQAKETLGETLERNALEKLAEPDDRRKKGMDGWKRDTMRALLVSSVDRKLTAEYQGNCCWNCSLAMRVFDEFLGLNALYATADTPRTRGGEV